MAADMGELDGVNLEQFIEPFPEIDVFYLAPAVFRFATPAVLFPVFHPTGNALANVAAVGDQLDGGWAVERFEPLDYSHHFHTVVGCFRLAATSLDFLARGRMSEYKSPSTRSRVSAASTVGEEYNFRFTHAFLMFPYYSLVVSSPKLMDICTV